MECDMAGGLYSLAIDGVTREPPMEVTLGLFTAQRATDNSYSQPSYSRNAPTDSAIPSYGSIEGEYSSYCAHTAADCVATATCDGTETTDSRWACESAGGSFVPAMLQVGDICYDTRVGSAGDCTGEFFPADNSFTVNNGLTMGDDGNDDTAAFATINCPSKDADGWTMTDIP